MNVGCNNYIIMRIDDKVIVKNYKCFDENGGGFEKILPINIIIGKNNSGKSSLIDLVRFLIELNKDFIELGRNRTRTEILIEHKLTEQEISKSFPSSTSGGDIPAQNFFEYGKSFIGKSYTYSLETLSDKTFHFLDAEFVNPARKLVESLTSAIKHPLSGKIYCNISAERDIIPEKSHNNLEFQANGEGATNYIQQILNRTNKDSRIIEKELLTELNKIVNPDIIFTRILVQLGDNEYWELYFEDAHNNRISLSKMGSGIKTVLLVLLNLIVRPKIEYKDPKNYVFAFEELENNLHPSLQRRLYDYIKKYSLKNSSYFFLTTHSNVVIDSFSTNLNSQLIHITNDGDVSKSTTILSYKGTKHIIDDLGIKASDILRNFINKWIELVNPDLKEGLHYSIMFYGGRLLSNLSFDFDWLKKELIPLLKINRNAFVVIDRDGKTIKAKLNQTKKRITEEIGTGNCWITQGREIENYLTSDTLSNWLKSEHNTSSKIENDKNIKLEENILSSDKNIKLQYNLNKTVFSSEIVEYIDHSNLEVLDLKSRINNLIEQIEIWNS